MNINEQVEQIHDLLEQIERDIEADRHLLNNSPTSIEDVAKAIESTLKVNLETLEEIQKELT